MCTLEDNSPLLLIPIRLDKVNGPVSVDPFDVGIASQFRNGIGRERHVQYRRQGAKVVMDGGRCGQYGFPATLILVFDVGGGDLLLAGTWFFLALLGSMRSVFR